MSTTDPIAMAPPGWLFSVLVFAMAKRGLEGLSDAAPERLQILERMERNLDERLTANVAAAIAPLSNEGHSLCAEALALDRPGSRCEASYKILTDPAVFALLAQTDPSLLEALNHMHHPKGVIRQ